MRRPGGIGVIVAAVGMMTVVSAALAAPAVAAPAAAAPVSRQVLYALGSNTFGELGDGTTTASTSPVLVSGLPGTVMQVAAGWETSAALLTNGTVWTWGNNYYGGLGYGYTGGAVSTPHQVPGLTGITQIAMSSEGNGYAVAPTAACGPGATTPMASWATGPRRQATPRSGCPA